MATVISSPGIQLIVVSSVIFSFYVVYYVSYYFMNSLIRFLGNQKHAVQTLANVLWASYWIYDLPILD